MHYQGHFSVCHDGQIYTERSIVLWLKFCKKSCQTLSNISYSNINDIRLTEVKLVSLMVRLMIHIINWYSKFREKLSVCV